MSSSPGQRLLLVATAMCFSACAVGLTTHTGPATSEGGAYDAPWSWSWSGGYTQALALPPLSVPIHLGMELEGRAQYRLGSSWSWGLQAGAAAAAVDRSRPGWMVRGDAGFPVRGGHLGGEGSYYVGAAAGLIFLVSAVEDWDRRNREFSFLGRHFELLPELRWRRTHDETLRWTGDPVRHEFSIGITIRYRLFSDIVNTEI